MDKDSTKDNIIKDDTIADSIGLFFIGLFSLWVIHYPLRVLFYFRYKYYIHINPCTEVYNGKELIYKGNAFHYQTESRGASIIYKEYEKTYFFPKITKEIMSKDLRIRTISCPANKKED